LPIQTFFNAALFILVLYALFTIGFPFLLAFLLALLLEPLVLLLSKKMKLRRIYAAFIICSLFTVVFVGVGYLLIYKVATEAVALSQAMISFLEEIDQGIGVLGERYQTLVMRMPLEYQEGIRQFAGTLFASMEGLLQPIIGIFFNLAKKVPNFFLQLVITFIAMFLISMRLPKKKQYFLNYFDPHVRPRVETVFKNLHHAVFGFLRAQIIISSFEYVFVLIGFLILGVNYPSATALLVTVVDIMPILGTGAVMVPMAIYQYLTGDVFQSIALIILYVVIIILRRIIDPKILGDAIGLSPLSVLISMYIGVVLTGFIGLFFGPAVVILFQALRKVGIINLNINF